MCSYSKVSNCTYILYNDYKIAGYNHYLIINLTIEIIYTYKFTSSTFTFLLHLYVYSDRRFGAQGQMVSTDMQRIFKMHDKLYVGMAGLASDVQTL